MRRVVVTGLGCVTPVGNNVTDFWDALMAGRHGFAPITKFDTSGMKASLAAEVKDFNPEEYISRGEIRRTDRHQIFAIAAGVQAVADAAIEGKIAPERFGVYIGSGIGGLDTLVTQTGVMRDKGADRVSPFMVTMMIANLASALVAIRANARGVNLPIVSACATATHSIGEAFRAIKHGYADAILTGGAESAINPLGIGGFTSAQALSTASDPDNASMPFDKRRNGFVMGEGAGILLLEAYEHAKARGARIYCEISGYGNTCDAHHVTAPHPEAEGTSLMIRAAFEEAAALAGVKMDEKLYINAHGTSTPLNDKAETLAIKKALGEQIAYKVPISSTKSMIGHLLGAAGGAEAIAAVKALQTGIVPPTAGYKEPDPDCDLDYVPNTARKADIDKAFSSSLGFGGHNAGVLFSKLEV